ncbi:MAG: C45 family autoproteolytic acyltransferase/hydrolase [Prosthecobacter sp.]|uniref:C45 family autoproteolytic acyltransferase/hydolase n=1 Tax=Prosthecobacter sp. TaxID=1965333 RepID=UPI0038FD6BD8
MKAKNTRRNDVNGWIHLCIEGKPRDRGRQHGRALATEIRAALKTIRYLILQDTGLEFAWFAKNAEALFHDSLASNYGGKLTDGSGVEILEEIEGIVEGANEKRGPRDAKLTLTDLIGWNAYPELICQWWPAVQSGQLKPAVPMPQEKARALAVQAAQGVHRAGFHPHHSCSAFVAVGKQTLDGEIVIAHTTWQRFANGDCYNVILDIRPENGARMLMQSVPGYVASSTDFMINSAGLAVTETSINGSGFDPSGLPEFFRARRAAQYGTSITSWCETFRLGNNGGYTNTWLLADVKKREISAYELTLHHDALQPVLKSGYYAGYNVPLDLGVRNFDVGAAGYDNLLQGAPRRVRFDALMALHHGKIDATIAQAILGDHHDPYTRAEFPCSRTICGHFDNDDCASGSGNPFYPWGSLDGKVTTGALAREMKILARWGRACGTPLDVKAFLREHPQFDWLRGHMQDRPSQPWTEFADVWAKQHS